ncbi:hypothetical protein F2Q68_00025153 [Brassica cretica]|uniref:Uncharacterized protein n=1 Tax=Brassica cretica TaxID=69181 RepID=A0A8S9ICX1_BRACR|nr:hypothetical protein F2Q68_00025153 [Brassica cretica]
MEVLLYRPICVEITRRTGKHFWKHFCTTHELRECREAFLYYIALCMRGMWDYREALMYYTYFWCRVCFMLELGLHSRSAMFVGRYCPPAWDTVKFSTNRHSPIEAFSAPIRGFATHVRIDSQSRISHAYDLDRKPLDPHMHRSDRFKTEKKQNTDHDDLRFRISGKRESLARTVWNRLDHSPVGIVPRDWERYHPYQKDLRADSRYTKRTTETPIKQGRYGDSASSSTRSNRSPDSQRTISEPHRLQRSDPSRRRTEQYSSYEPRLEWQPVRAATRSREEQHRDDNEQNNEQEMERESKEDRRRRIKGKAAARNSGDKEGNGASDGGASGTFKTKEPLPNNVTLPKEIPVTQVNTTQNMQSTQSQEKGLAVQKTPTPSSPEQAEKRDNQIPMSERLKIGFTGKNPAAQETDLLTEEEINQMADQYASVDFDMDEDMLNDDDLLDEELEENTRSDPSRRRTEQYSSYEPRLEWQPVRAATRSREEQHRDDNEQNNEQEMERESKEDRRRRIKGKAAARNSGDKEGNGASDGGASGTFKTKEPLPNNVTLPKEIPVTQVNTTQNMQSTQSQEKGLAVQKTPTPSSPEQAEKRDNQIPMSERLKIGFTGKNPAAQETDLLTEEEINQMADQYASVDFDMDEDMLNDDDLLDEELEENTVIP